MAPQSALCLSLSLLWILGLCSCAPSEPSGGGSIDDVAESFVKLSLALGEHDPDYVDAYLGPEEWRAEVKEEALAAAEVRRRAEEELDRLSALNPPDSDLEAIHRHVHLVRSLQALIARVDLLEGKTMSFDDESLALYDAVAPSHSEEDFQTVLDRLGEELPGEGRLVDRFEDFRVDFVIPADRLDAVFEAAIRACRERTRHRIDLPAEEAFELEYVTDKSWSGYNWYQGGYRSLIQLNTDLPITIDRALDLACHEGYPGHHVYNVLLERELVRGRGWVEFSIYPLFSPRSLIAEGTANFGIEVAFPDDERIAFEREVLFPLAGLDPDRAESFYRVQELKEKLDYAGNEAARRYLEGRIGREEAESWLVRIGLMSPERAAQRVRFIDQYRAYVINYNLGEDMVRAHVEALGGTPDDPERRWEVFTELLSSPVLPSQLQG